MTEPLGAAPRFVGQSVGRKENKRFLTGRGRYVDDFMEAGMLHAAILRSPLARANITVDASAARELPGVWAVYTAADINDMFEPLVSVFGDAGPFGVRTVLAETQVSYVGDPIAIAIADDRYIAEDALELIDVDYDPLDAVASISAAKSSPSCIPGRDTNLAFEMSLALPGSKEAFESAAQVVTARIAQGRISPSPMEGRGIISNPIMDGKLEVRLSSQNPHAAKSFIARSLRLQENHVRVMSPDIGGAFGQKFGVNRDFLATIAASLKLRRPVKWIEDKPEALQAGGHGRAEELELSIALDASGQMLATHFKVEDNGGADPVSPPGGLTQLMAMIHTGAYDIPTMMADCKAYFTNTCGSTAYRGPWAGETLIREITVDKAARAMGMDPVEFRRRNVVTQWPHKLPMGLIIDDVSPLETLDRAVEKIGYAAFRAEQAKARAEGRYLGIGIGLCIEPTAISPGGGTDTAEVRIETTGKITAVLTCHSQGHSVETTMAQIIADEMGVGVDDVTIAFGDTDSITSGSGAGGSRQAVVAGGAAHIASGLLRDKVFKLAAHFLQTEPEGLKLEGGSVVGSGPSAPSITLAALGKAANVATLTLPEGMEAGLTARYCYTPPPFTFANACHAAIVEADPGTGLVKVLRYVVAEDCGVMLNPAVVEGQIAGGVIQGIGNALWEEQHYDEAGNPSAGTYKDYILPVSTDAPTIEYVHVCTPSKTPTGAKGVGEGGAIVGAPTIFNAVMDALAPFDPEFEQLPLTPSRILAGLRAKG
jgi:carbon-monoxide dehydrogenase large subunit